MTPIKQIIIEIVERILNEQITKKAPLDVIHDLKTWLDELKGK